MTLPLKKDREEAMPEMDPRPGSEMPEPEEDLDQEGPQLVRHEASRGTGQKQPEVQPDGDATPLLVERDRQDLQNRWDQIQTGFVDEPRKSVHDADALVSSAIDRLSKGFATERSKLEQQWDKGDTVSTEDLRVALQRYRSFFHRVLSI
jgi:hypothetical protein